PTYQNGGKRMEADGVRWDLQENPLEYNLLPYHPGNMLFPPMGPIENWINADTVLHWFRQDRGWLRGIPEFTTSLPLCALLRRYTLAVVHAAEIGADISGVIESEAPPAVTAQLLADGDDPFDVIPFETGMLMRLPWGYKLSQLRAEQPIQVYDMFVNTLLREILRPINMPFNLAAGTSKDSNMASAIVDSHIYRGAQKHERDHCESHILNMLFCMWYQEARLIDGYLPAHQNRTEFPTRSWRWDKVGLDHTDPDKVMKALETAHSKGFLTDRDIQEQHFNRDYEEWQDQLRKDKAFRDSIQLPIVPPVDTVLPPAPVPAWKNGSNGRSAKGSEYVTEAEVASIVDRMMNDARFFARP
ncbi:MAG TPA: phage portal protein, partial [Nitrospira sp.]|nr:phage portal protein [Nitrospira sp.]